LVEQIIQHSLIAVTTHQVINMEPDGMLTAFDLAIGNTGVIRIELETNAFKLSSDLLVQQ
jgi:hypothetical protein